MTEYFERIQRLATPEACRKFIDNALARGRPDVAEEARVQCVKLEAANKNSATPLERELWETIAAYEEALSSKNGRPTRASRTRQMLDRHGAVQTIERIVCGRRESTGYALLLSLGLSAYTFEAIVLRHGESFSDEAVAQAGDRLQALSL